MVENITKKVMQEVDTTVGEECKCDICNKVIYNYITTETADYKVKTRDKIIYYWHAYTGHYDWGNDSVDSIEHFDLCSKECCKELTNKYLDEMCSESRTAYLKIDKESKLITRGMLLQEGDASW